MTHLFVHPIRVCTNKGISITSRTIPLPTLNSEVQAVVLTVILIRSSAVLSRCTRLISSVEPRRYQTLQIGYTPLASLLFGLVRREMSVWSALTAQVS